MGFESGDPSLEGGAEVMLWTWRLDPEVEMLGK